MNFNFIGKDSVITEELKKHTEEKLSKLDKFLPEGTTANVRYIVHRNENRIEVTIQVGKRVLRGEVSTDDMRSAVDRVLEVLERQLRSYKGRLKDRYRQEAKYEAELNTMTFEQEEEFDKVEKIERVKRFSIRPMHSEDAIMEMELLSHDFFVFINSDNDEVNVVYRRNNGTYGLMVPEY